MRWFPRPARGTSTVELAVLLAVMSAIVAVAVAQFVPVSNDVATRSAPLVLSAAVVDAHAVAVANQYVYPLAADQMVAAMNSTAQARASATTQVEYIVGSATTPEVSAGAGVTPVSVAVGSATQVGLATVAALSGRAYDAVTCVLAADTMRAGTQYAVMADAPRTAGHCSGAVAVACSPAWSSLPGEGTVARPFELASSHACVSRALGDPPA